MSKGAGVLGAVALVLALSVRAVEVDGIVARVGTETILQSEVVEEMQRLGIRDREAFADIRNRLIDRKLILKAAADAKMTLQDWMVENRIREIVQKAFGGDRNKLIEVLGKQKISYPEWQAKTREDMIVSAMKWNVIDKNVSPSPAAMRQEYASHPERYSESHVVSVTVILLRPEEKARREEISKALKEKSFEDLGGKKYENVNPTEFFKPQIVKEIASMPKGTISHWIEIDGWSFLLRKDGEKSGKKMSFDEAYDKVEEAVRREETERLYKAWLERLRAETYIRVF